MTASGMSVILPQFEATGSELEADRASSAGQPPRRAGREPVFGALLLQAAEKGLLARSAEREDEPDVGDPVPFVPVQPRLPAPENSLFGAAALPVRSDLLVGAVEGRRGADVGTYTAVRNLGEIPGSERLAGGKRKEPAPPAGKPGTLVPRETSVAVRDGLRLAGARAEITGLRAVLPAPWHGSGSARGGQQAATRSPAEEPHDVPAFGQPHAPDEQAASPANGRPSASPRPVVANTQPNVEQSIVADRAPEASTLPGPRVALEGADVAELRDLAVVRFASNGGNNSGNPRPTFLSDEPLQAARSYAEHRPQAGMGPGHASAFSRVKAGGDALDGRELAAYRHASPAGILSEETGLKAAGGDAPLRPEGRAAVQQHTRQQAAPMAELYGFETEGPASLARYLRPTTVSHADPARWSARQDAEADGSRIQEGIEPAAARHEPASSTPRPEVPERGLFASGDAGALRQRDEASGDVSRTARLVDRVAEAADPKPDQRSETRALASVPAHGAGQSTDFRLQNLTSSSEEPATEPEAAAAAGVNQAEGDVTGRTGGDVPRRERPGAQRETSRAADASVPDVSVAEAAHEQAVRAEDSFLEALRASGDDNRPRSVTAPSHSEARRFAAMLEPESLGDIIRTVSLEGGEQPQAVRVELHPRELGRLHLRVAVENGSVNAQIAAESEAVRQAIEAALPQLRQSLQEGGLNVGTLDVFVGADAGGFGQPQDAQPAQPSTRAIRRRLTEVEPAYGSAAVDPAPSFGGPGRIDVLV